MAKLPLIVGQGGMNSAGRTSGFHSYKRMISDVLSPEEIKKTWHDFANRMGISDKKELTEEDIQSIKDGTLVRKITQFDPENITFHHKAILDQTNASFLMKKSKLSKALADLCEIEDLENNEIRVSVKSPFDILVPDRIKGSVSSGGCIPEGFDPGERYHSPHHPRGLKLTVYGASDALNSLGLEWDEILQHIYPDEVAVYAGSGLAQIDEHSLSGLIRQPLCGNRINSKMMALSLAEMPADFINSYILNSVGTTGNNIGACASFLYNLRQGVIDIQQGKAKVVFVGNSEAPVVPEVVDGFRVMGALATDDSLCTLDNTDEPNNRRACRPFSTNTGFTLAESVQFFVLMEDELALKLGMTIYGSVPEVFINADANKKSIASPGIGNYITIAKATALAKSILGKDGLQKTYIQAHGTGTPQNRITESHILNEVAKTFEIKDWPVSAVKSYVGHSVSVAGGDQLASTLGVWKHGYIPGIKTIDHIASDVHQSNLDILTDHKFVGDLGNEILATIINSKGFGGNNASTLILSPAQTIKMLTVKYGQETMDNYRKTNKSIKAHADEVDNTTCYGNERTIYKFGESIMDQDSVTISQTDIKLSEFERAINLPTTHLYEDYIQPENKK
ncbi:MAG: beta-ketoacyl synthase [Legionellaceae bacterium]|nr:beta-ketoacyl synthase [Legionellaceae bacterium]